MEITTPVTIILLKKDLNRALEKNHFDLLSPEVIALSEELDRLMMPLFEHQLQLYTTK